MTRADMLRDKADRTHAEFFQSVDTLSDQMRPRLLINELVGKVDPDFNVLKRFQKQMERNQFIALAVVASILLLARQRRDTPAQRNVMRHAKRNPRLTSAVQKRRLTWLPHQRKTAVKT